MNKDMKDLIIGTVVGLVVVGGLVAISTWSENKIADSRIDIAMSKLENIITKVKARQPSTGDIGSMMAWRSQAEMVGMPVYLDVIMAVPSHKADQFRTLWNRRLDELAAEQAAAKAAQ